MRKVFDRLDSRQFPGDWVVADMIKQFLRGHHKQIIKKEKLTREADAYRLAKERCRRQAVLEKWMVLAEDDPKSLAIEGTNDDNEELDNNPNWPPARPHKKQHITPSGSDDSGSQSSGDE